MEDRRTRAPSSRAPRRKIVSAPLEGRRSAIEGDGSASSVNASRRAIRRRRGAETTAIAVSEKHASAIAVSRRDGRICAAEIPTVLRDRSACCRTGNLRRAAVDLRLPTQAHLRMRVPAPTVAHFQGTRLSARRASVIWMGAGTPDSASMSRTGSPAGTARRSVARTERPARSVRSAGVLETARRSASTRVCALTCRSAGPATTASSSASVSSVFAGRSRRARPIRTAP